MRGIRSLGKYLVLGAVVAAPIVGTGCNTCNQSPCDYEVISTAPVSYETMPVAVQTVAATPVVYVDGGAVISTAAYTEPTGGVIYKPIPSRNIAAAMSNVDSAGIASTNGNLVSSVVSKSEYQALQSAQPATIPVMQSSYVPVANATGYSIGDDGTASFIDPVGGVAMAPRVSTMRGRPVQAESALVGAPVAAGGMQAGTPVYVTPGGTPVSSYVPAPASGTYLDGAAPTGYLPVTERRGPHDAVVHYATRSICKYDPETGEDCVWTSGF